MAEEKEIVKAVITYSDGSTKEIKDGYFASVENGKISAQVCIALMGNMREKKNLLFFLDSVLKFAAQTGLDKELQEFYASHAEEE